jgi:hypothetical protein
VDYPLSVHSRFWLAIAVSLLLLSGCALAGVPLGWGWLGAVLAAVALLLGACVPDVTTEPTPQNPFVLQNFDAGTLATGDGTKGFVVDTDQGVGLGVSVALGNINGDGFADVAIGGLGGTGGTAYVAAGHAPPFSPIINAPFADIRLYGVAGAGVGGAVVFVGDISGDGFEDLAIGMPQYNASDGAVAILFGGTALPSTGTLYGGFLSGTGGPGTLLATFSYSDQVGYALAPASNLVGDAKMDLVVGAPIFGEYYTTAGQAMVVDGAITGDPVPGDMNPGLRGQRLMAGADRYYLGAAVAGGGDVNGDGRTDVLMGAPGSTYGGGVPARAFLLFAESTTGGVQTIVPGASSVFTFTGAVNDCTGCAVALGNLNGDSFADLIIGAPDAGPGYAGRVTLVFGGSGLDGATMDAASMNGVNGFNIWGSVPFEGIGQSVAFAGDINGDGYPDLLIGASYLGYSGPPYYTSYVMARAYLIFGGPGPWPANLYLSQLTSSQGIVIHARNNYWGENSYFTAVAGGRDVDGDGLPDLVMSDSSFNFGSGRAYVVFHKALGK